MALILLFLLVILYRQYLRSTVVRVQLIQQACDNYFIRLYATQDAHHVFVLNADALVVCEAFKSKPN